MQIPARENPREKLLFIKRPSHKVFASKTHNNDNRKVVCFGREHFNFYLTFDSDVFLANAADLTEARVYHNCE